VAKRTDANQAKIMEALRKAGASVWDTHELGHGFPDLAVGWMGRTYLIEVKAGPHSPLTPDEVTWHGVWRGHAAILNSPAKALAEIGLVTAPVSRYERNYAQTGR
jgi:hypothetical protein